MKTKGFVHVGVCIIFSLLLGLSMASCGILKDLFHDGKNEKDTYKLDVHVHYSGSKTVGNSSPIYVSMFDYLTNLENATVQKITSFEGDISFKRTEDMYGILVFIDEVNNQDIDVGEVYQFYHMKSSDPDMILLDDNHRISISFNDAYAWKGGGFGFHEDFDDGSADNWVDDGNWEVIFGEYVKKDDTSPWGYSYYDEDFSDFTYSVDIWQTSGDPDLDRGLIFRSLNPWEIEINFNGYLLSIREKTTPASSMQWRLARYDAGVEAELIGYADSSLLNFGTNKLTVTCSGSTISIYLNDNFVANHNDSTYLNGKVGLYARDHPTQSYEFHYDNAHLSLP